MKSKLPCTTRALGLRKKKHPFCSNRMWRIQSNEACLRLALQSRQRNLAVRERLDSVPFRLQVLLRELSNVWVVFDQDDFGKQ